MSDLIDRIKSLRFVHVPQASQLFEEAIAEIERLRLAPAEREAINAMACYFDTKGNIQMQAWGSLLRVILLRIDATGHQ